MIKRLASTCVLALGVAAYAGSASAENGNGNGKGKPDAVGGPVTEVVQAAAPGNSANAAGQIKKEAAAAPAVAPVTAAGTIAGNTDTQAGTKPASDTQKDTHEAASSDKTKLYGNGQTAGQIAVHNGAPASTILHGPGNSQPHKAALCSGGHEVDVHALKGKRTGKSCRPDSPTPGSDPDPGHGPAPGGGPSGGGSSSQGGGAPGATPAGPQDSPADPGSQSSGGQESAGALAETSMAGPAGSSLPFTGFPLWVAFFVGIGLILAGFTLLWRVEATE
jgi:hypothetical protein